MCVCGPLFVTCCYWGVVTTVNVSATQTEDVWSETMPSVQTNKFIPKFPSCCTLFECSSEQVTVGRWQTCCLVSFNNYRIVCLQASEFIKKRKTEICVSWRPSDICPVLCPVRMPRKLYDFVIEVNSKYSFTDRKEHQFHKTLLEVFNSTKFGEGKNDVIWQYLHQLNSTFFMNFGNRRNRLHNIFDPITPSSN